MTDRFRHISLRVYAKDLEYIRSIGINQSEFMREGVALYVQAHKKKMIRIFGSLAADQAAADTIPHSTVETRNIRPGIQDPALPGSTAPAETHRPFPLPHKEPGPGPGPAEPS